MTDFTDVNISNQLKLHCEVDPKSKQDIVNAIWGWQNGIWQPLQQGGGLTFGDSFLTLKDTTVGNGEKEAQLFLIIQQDGDEIEPLVGTNKGLVVQKDFAAGGFLSSNQGMLSLGSGLNWQCDRPKIVLGHSGRPILYNIEERSSEPPTHQQLQLYINTNDDHLYEYHEEGQEPHWHDKGNISNYSGNFDTLYLKKFFSEDPAHLDLGDLTAHGKLMLKSTNSVFAVAAGDNFDPQHPEDPFDTYLIPQNPSEGGLGLGSYGHPFEWINIKHLFLHADETHAAALSVDHGVINEEDYYYINPSSNTGLGSDDHHFKWVDTDAVFVYADNDHAAQLTAGYDAPNAYLTTPRLKVNEITTNDGSGFTFSEKGIAFIIRKKGNYYEAINGSSGDLAFGGADAKGGVSGTYATPVIKAAINALTPDRDYLQWIKLVGHITLTKDGANDYCIKITELTGLDLTSASLTLENSQNCDMIRIESTGNPQEHCWIKGGIIEGNKTNNTTGDGIKVWNGSHNILEEVTVRNCAGHGIRLTGDAAAWAGLHRVLDCRSYFNGGCGFVTNNQSDDFFLNCISQSNLSYGFWLLYPQQLYRCHSIYNAAGFNIQSHCHLVECYADTNHRHGFYADSAVGTVYQLWFNNCYAYRNSQQTTNTYDGFHIENINDVQFVNCRSKPSITDPDGPNQRYGYYINGCDNVSFSNCMAQYNDNHGFFISNSEYSSVTGCQSRQNKGHGYRLENTVGCAVTGCIGTSNTMNGLSAYICADLSITGGSYNYNSVGTTTYHGVSLNGDSNNCAINGVTARENGGYQIAILAAACDNCVIEGCTTSVSTVGSISNSGTDCIVRNNRGYVTEVSGTVTMLNGNNYIEVPYLLGDTLHRLTAPSGKIHWTFRNVPLTELGDTWVQDVDNDSFTIRVRNAPNVDVSIGWEIRL